MIVNNESEKVEKKADVNCSKTLIRYFSGEIE
jgi:hypothetical protein